MNLTAPFAFARYAARVLLPLQRMGSGCTRHRFAWHTLTPEQRELVHEVLRNNPLITAREVVEELRWAHVIAKAQQSGCCAGNQWYEIAPSHSSTSSARARSAGGIVSVRVPAVLRLMTRSNLVGYNTGSAAGRAPARILPA
jgi:hypothetical protein